MLLTGSSFKINQEVNAVVIWVDVCTNSVQLSVRPDVLKQIHKDQGIVIKKKKCSI
jgi:ribosomal protein S1